MAIFVGTKRVGPACRSKDYIIYELHVGTFTPEGTFDAVIPTSNIWSSWASPPSSLCRWRSFPASATGATTAFIRSRCKIPMADRAGLKQLVNACHRRGLAVILDVVYNHLGPEGNYLADFGPYFTDRYKTPGGRRSISTARTATR